jgi:Protein of unknown function (DUF2795)
VADNMQSGPDQISAYRDEVVKQEMQGWLRSGHPTRAEEWDDVEPGADDDPEITERPVAPPMSLPGTAAGEETEDEALRSELARHLRRHAFPTDREGLKRELMDGYAPEPLVETVRELPKSGGTYGNVQEVMAALGRKPRS